MSPPTSSARPPCQAISARAAAIGAARSKSSAGAGHPARLVDQLARPRVAAPRADECPRDEPDGARVGGVAVLVDQQPGRRRGLRPAPLVELGACAAGEHREPPEVELELVAERDPLGVPAVRGVVRAVEGGRIAEVVERAGGPRGVLVPLGEVERPLQRVGRARPVAQELAGPDRDRRIERGRSVPGRLRELDRPRAGPQRPLEVVLIDPQEREPCIRPRELVPGREQRQQLDRSLGRGLRIRQLPAAGEVGHDPAECVGLAAAVARGTVELDRLLQHLDRSPLLVRAVEGVGAALEQRRALPGGQAVREAQGPGVVRGRLAVSPGRGGALGGGDGVAEDCLAVARGIGVMGEPREVRPSVGGLRQRDERPPVQVEPASRLQRLLERQPGEIVAELDRPGPLDEDPGVRGTPPARRRPRRRARPAATAPRAAARPRPRRAGSAQARSAVRRAPGRRPAPSRG